MKTTLEASYDCFATVAVRTFPTRKEALNAARFVVDFCACANDEATQEERDAAFAELEKTGSLCYWGATFRLV